MDNTPENHEDKQALPENAYLIIEGTKAIAIDQPLITIGRQNDNTVVIDDPRVSRHHAQLRLINGRFVLFDIGSSGGIFLNGRKVGQSVLYPGDVISLAGVDILFMRDVPIHARGDTVELPRGLGQRATAIFRTWFFGDKGE